MKVLIIHTKYNQTGGEDAVVDQEAQLLRQEHDVEILYFQNKVGISGALQFLISIWNRKSAQVLRAKINEFKPDVVHLHNFHFAGGPLLIRVVKKMNHPLVQTLHNYRLLCPSAILLHNNQLFLNSLDERFPWTAIRNKVYRNSSLLTFWLSFVFWWHKKIGTFNKVDRYICLTDFSKELMQKNISWIDSKKFVVKPNFTESIAVINKTERQNHFLFIGRLSEEKGIEVLLKAFENTNYQLRIAGDGPLKNLVEQKTLQHSNIKYLGVLNKTAVNRELSSTQALIFPSIWYEGMPMTILEAFSNSTPVIASNIGAMSTMIEHSVNGLHFEVGNYLDLQAQLDSWENRPHAEMQKNVLETFEKQYAPDLQMNYFNQIYQGALNK